MYKKYLTAMAGALLLLTGCGSDEAGNGSSQQPPPGAEANPVLRAIQVDAAPVVTIGSASLTLAKGNTQPFVATALYDDGSKVDITASASWQLDDSVATIASNGYLTGLRAGEVTVTARYEGVTSNPVTLAVTDAVITAITVAPQRMPQQRLRQAATDLALPLGSSHPLSVTADYSDGTRANIIYSDVSWAVDPAVATISPDGLLTIVGPGSLHIQVQKDAVSSPPLRVDVTQATLSGLTISAATMANGTLSLPKGVSQSLVVIAHYSDGGQLNVSKLANWQVTQGEIVRIDESGRLQGVAPGTTRVTARYGNQVSPALPVVVTEAVLTRLRVTYQQGTSGQPLPVGASRQMEAIGTYSDYSQRRLTGEVAWQVAPDAVASVTQAQTGAGMVQGLAPGSASITASLGGITSEPLQVEVIESELVGIELTSAQIVNNVLTLPVETAHQLTATGVYSNGHRVPLTAGVVWLVEPATGIVSVTQTGEGVGTLLGLAPGAASITASLGNITSAPLQMAVTEAIKLTGITLTAPQIEDNTLTLPAGVSYPLTAMGTFSDGSSKTLTDRVRWQLVEADDNTAQMLDSESGAFSGTELCSTNSDRGCVWVHSDGVVKAYHLPDNRGFRAAVTASLDGIDSVPLQVVVNNARLTRIMLTHDGSAEPLTLAKGLSQQLTATGEYSDGSHFDLTQGSNWTVSNGNVATVGAKGLLTAIKEGAVNVVVKLVMSNFTFSSDPLPVVVAPAALNSITLVSELLVDNALTLAAGVTHPVKAIGEYSDGERDLSDAVEWLPEGGNITVERGELTAHAPGVATLAARKDDITSQPISIDILPLALSSMTADVSAKPTNITTGGEPSTVRLQLTYSDGVAATGYARAISFDTGVAKDVAQMSAVTEDPAHPGIYTATLSGKKQAVVTITPLLYGGRIGNGNIGTTIYIRLGKLTCSAIDLGYEVSTKSIFNTVFAGGEAPSNARVFSVALGTAGPNPPAECKASIAPDSAPDNPVWTLTKVGFSQCGIKEERLPNGDILFSTEVLIKTLVEMAPGISTDRNLRQPLSCTIWNG